MIDTTQTVISITEFSNEPRLPYTWTHTLVHAALVVMCIITTIGLIIFLLSFLTECVMVDSSQMQNRACGYGAELYSAPWF